MNPMQTDHDVEALIEYLEQGGAVFDGENRI